MIINATGAHNYFLSLRTAPTCANNGYNNYTCTICRNSYTETVSATGQHIYKETINKATTSKNGNIIYKCNCGKIESTTIYYPKTIKLSATSFVYDGKVKKPSVTVIGSDGKTISSSNYTVSYSTGRKNVGKYSVKISFKNGMYSGTKSVTFAIKPKVKTSATLYAGAKTSVSAKSNAKITYKTSNSKVAKVDAKGNITAVAKGTANITATSNGQSSVCKVTVKPISITLNKTSANLYKGGSVTLKATTTPSGKKVTWSTSNSKVATVSSSGKVTAKGKGSATITASFKYNGKTYKKTCKVKVMVKPSKVEMAAKASILIKNVYLKNPSSYTIYNIFYVGDIVYIWYGASNSFGAMLDGWARVEFSKTSSNYYYSINASSGGYILVNPDYYRPSTYSGTVSISDVKSYISKNPHITYTSPYYYYY